MNVMTTIKYSPTITTSTRYYIKRPSSLGRFLECRKCNILVATQELVRCLICPHSPSGAERPRASCVHIRQRTRACVTTITCIYIYIYIYRIVQKFRGTKLSRLDHHVSIRGKTFIKNVHY